MVFRSEVLIMVYRAHSQHMTKQVQLDQKKEKHLVDVKTQARDGSVPTAVMKEAEEKERTGR